MRNRLNRLQILASLTALSGMSGAYAKADTWQLNMYRGVTPISREMYDLHMIAMAVCGVIGIIVFGIMIYSLVHHRKSRGYVPAKFHDNPRLEIFWAVIPFLILVGLAIPATTILFRMDDNRDSDVTIKVVGSQWKWQYQYLDQGIQYFSNLATPYDQIQNKQKKGEWYLLEVDKPLVLPIHRKIRFLVTSTDVVHSWWVPELGVKRDAIPGFMYEAWAVIEKPGVYRGQCAELCGINHGFMPIVVQAVSDDAFNAWVAEQTKVEDAYAASENVPADQPDMTRAELISLGREKYNLICAACHKADGTGLNPLYPPLKGSSVAVGHPVTRHIEMILNGVPNSAMQPYRDQLTDTEIAAIATYERNAWGNNTNDIIQPRDVAKAREAGNQAPAVVNKVNAGGLR